MIYLSESSESIIEELEDEELSSEKESSELLSVLSALYELLRSIYNKLIYLKVN